VNEGEDDSIPTTQYMTRETVRRPNEATVQQDFQIQIGNRNSHVAFSPIMKYNYHDMCTRMAT